MRLNVLVFVIGVVLLVVATYSIHRIVFAGTRYYSFESKDFVFWVNVVIVLGCVGLGAFGAIVLSGVRGITSFRDITQLVGGGFICILAIAGSIFLLDFLKAPHQDPIDLLTKSIIVLGMTSLFVAIDGRLFHVLGKRTRD